MEDKDEELSGPAVVAAVERLVRYEEMGSIWVFWLLQRQIETVVVYLMNMPLNATMQVPKLQARTASEASEML
uniref:Uncharacterized protein n=1 Tax=Oryza sativa subsp. japonica TaxID=39947 RepID=Q10DN7_ORYSJ|nr:hypothetical protein LOC_Os03g51556 [Oryza sativa Japonica Group]